MMQKSELIAFLALVSGVDNREIDDVKITAWFDAIGHLDLFDARRALKRHRAESTEYLQPAHITALVKRIRQDDVDEERRQLGRHRTEHVFPPKPDNWDAMSAAWKDPVGFAREVAAYDQQLIADGFPPVPTVTGAPFPNAPTRGQGRDFGIPAGDR